MTPSVSEAEASMVTDADVVNDAPAAGDVIDTDGAEFAEELMPQASTSMTRLEPFRAAVMKTRIFDVEIGANRVCRHTRLLFVTTPPGRGSHTDPSQYCTSKFLRPQSVNVIVGVGVTGDPYSSCIEKTFTSSISFMPAKSTWIQSGYAFVVPSFLMVLAIGWAYVAYGGLTWMQAVFYGVGAAVIGIIALSAYKLTQKAVGKDWLLWGIFLTSAGVTVVTLSLIHI